MLSRPDYVINLSIYGAGPTRLRNASLYLTCRRSSLGSSAQSEGRCCAAAAGAASSPLPGGAHESMGLCLPSTAPAPPLFTLKPQNSSGQSSIRVSTSCFVPGATPRWTASPGGAVWASTTPEQDPRTLCFAKCPCTCQFDRLSDQLCQSLDRLSDHFAKHCPHSFPRAGRENADYVIADAFA